MYLRNFKLHIHVAVYLCRFHKYIFIIFIVYFSILYKKVNISLFSLILEFEIIYFFEMMPMPPS